MAVEFDGGDAKNVFFADTTDNGSSFDTEQLKARAEEQASRDVVVVDTTVDGYEALLDGIADGTEIIQIGEGGLAELASALEGQSGITSLQILSHGDVGTLYLGGDALTEDNLADHADLMATIGGALTEDGDLLLYGCRVGEGGEGMAFLEALQQATGADIAASDDLTGAESLDGDWDLEATLGDVETVHTVSAASMVSFDAVLAAPSAGTVDFGTGISVLQTDGAGPVTDLLSSGLDFTYSGNTDAIDMTLIQPSDGIGGVNDAEYGRGNAWDGKAFVWGHVVGSGAGLVGTANVINYVSVEANDNSSTFDLDGFVFFYRADAALTFTVSAYDSGGSQIGSSVNITGFSTANTDGASDEFTVQFATISDSDLGSDFDSITEFRITPSDPNQIAVMGIDNIVIDTAVSNTAPELGGTPADDTATEDVATAIDLSAYNISDSDGDDPITITLAVDRGTIASVDGNGTSDSVTISNSGTTSMTLSGSAANLNTYLNDTSHITFTTDSNDTTSATLTVTPNDGTEDGTADTVTISITAVNDDPTVSGVPSDIAFAEDTSSNVSLTTVDLSDVDSASVTLTITASEGTFGTPADGAGTGSGVTETRVSDTVVTLAGAPDDIDTYLDTASNITWTPAENDNGGDTSTFTLTVNDGDGSGDVALGTVNADVTAVNDAPTATGGPADITVTEETASDVDLSAVDFSDVDSPGTVFVTLTASEGTLTASTDGTVSVNGSGSAAITLTGTFDQIESYLDTTTRVTYTGTTDDSGDNAATLTVSANDDDGSGDVTLFTSNFDITDVNDDPEVSGLVTDLNFIEDSSGIVNLSAADFDDVDSASITVTITASEGTFGTPADGAGTGSGVTETRVSDTVVTLVGAANDIDTYLDTTSNITWTPAQDDNGSDTSTFTITANDGDGSGDVSLGTINADVTAVNDAPTATGGPADITVSEETASDVDLSAVDFSDVDSAGTVSVTLTASEGTLNASTDGTVSVSGDGTAAITLTGTFDQIETYLDTTTRVTYTGATDDSGDNAATLTVSANDDDGSGDVTLFTSNFDITDVNDDPSVSGLVTDIGFTEDTSGNVNLSAADFDDVDSASITVTITASEGTFGTPADGNPDVVETRVSDTVVTLVGAADDIDTYLDTASNITWTPEENDNGDNTSTFTITANDGEGSGDVALGTVNADVTSVNDDPSATGGPADITVTEDTASNVDLSGVDFTDVDSAGTVSVTLTASEGTLTAAGGITTSGSGTSTVTLTGTFDAIETYLDTTNAITYTSAADDSGDNAATLTVTANDDDGSGDVTQFTSNFDITAVNDAPILDSTASHTLTGIDEDAGDDDGSGADGDDDGTDNANNTGDTVASIVADASVTDADGSATESIAVTNVDNTNGLWQYSTDSGTSWNNFSGTSGSSVDISANARLLEDDDLIRFVPGGDYQSTATLTFRAWDESAGTGGDTLDGSSGGGTSSLSSNTDTMSVSVSGVNDAPEFSGLDDTPAFTEGGSAVTLDDDVTVSDVELDSIDDFSGAVLTVARNGGASNDDTFAVASGGNLTVAGGPNGGGTITAGGNVIATISNAGDDDELTITFADNGTTPTGALLDEVLQAITYSNSSDDPGSSVQLDWSISDGNSGNAQGTGDNPGTDSGSITVTITEVNDEPSLTATGSDPTFNEGGANTDLFSTVTADTVEAGQTFSSFTITVTNVSDSGEEFLNMDGTAIDLTTDVTSQSTVTNTLTYDMTLSGGTATIDVSGGTLTEAQLQTLIDGMTYANTSEAPSTLSNRVVSVTSLTDSGGTANSGDDTASLTLTSTVSLTSVNDAPVIGSVDSESSSVVAGNGDTNVDLFDDATVTDADSDDFNGGFLTITQNTGTTNGNWSVDGTNVTSGGDGTISAGETIVVNGDTIGTVDGNDDGQGGNDLRITFTTSDANADTVEDFLQNLEYEGPSVVDARTFTVTLADGDGTAGGGANEDSADFTINVTPNPPVIGNLDGDSLTFTEGASNTDIDVGGNVTVTDSDSADFDGGDLTISISAGQEDDDRLRFDEGTVTLGSGHAGSSTVTISGTNIGTIDGGSTGGSGEDLVISLNSSATPALIQALLATVQYGNAGGDNPTDGDRTISVTLTDGTGGTSSTADVTVNVNPVNDNPTLTGGPADITVVEEDSSDVDLSGLDFNDDDSPDDVTVTLTASEGTLAANDDDGVVVANSGTSSITLTGNYDEIEAFLADTTAVQYTGTTNDAGDNAATLTVVANDGDGSGNVTLLTSNFDITDVNDAPTSSNGSITDSESAVFSFDANDFNFSDVDAGDTLASIRIDSLPSTGTFQLSSVDVSVNDVIAVGDLGNLEYTPDGPGDESFGFTVNDGTAFAASGSTMTLTASQDNSRPDEPRLLNSSVRENDAGATVGTVRALDPDSDRLTLTVSGDSRFEINESNQLKLKDGVSLDFETDESIDLTITARDPSGATNSTDVTITVIDVNEQTTGDDDDTVTGSDNDDNVSSGGGNDNVNTGNGKDTIDGGDGDDNINGGDDDDLLLGGTGNDTVEGGTGEDTLRGGLGNDLVDAGDDDDLVFAGLGDQGDDQVLGGGGLDSLGGGFGNDLLQGEDNDDLLWGRFGDDTVDGGTGNDMLYNGEGTDTVVGGTGDDTLWAGNDDDFLEGGDGEDTFMFGAVSGKDTIRDFDIDDDQINLQYSGAGYSTVAEVVANSTAATQGGESGVLIDIGNDQSIFIVGLTLGQLNSVDFVL